MAHRGGGKGGRGPSSTLGNETVVSLQEAIKNADKMPELRFDFDLGVEGLERIMPDTWKNISWVI